MRNYFIKTPWWLIQCFPNRLWRFETTSKKIYLSFDDGPHPIATPFVLDMLQQYNAKATFFCIGKNVIAYPEIYQRLLNEGHRVGNHTYNHLNGWKTENAIYLADIQKAASVIQSALFRPPYGRIKVAQAKQLKNALADENAKIVMWDVLSGDFDQNLTAEKCTKFVLNQAKEGSIIVFHDSDKAWERLRHTLPAVLQYFTKLGFEFCAID